jgi:hypothetical protein
MDWTEEALRSAYRSDNPKPAQQDELFAQLGKLQEETSIEFYEMYGES